MCQTNGWTNAVDGQPKNIMPLLTVSASDGIKVRNELVLKQAHTQSIVNTRQKSMDNINTHSCDTAHGCH